MEEDKSGREDDDHSVTLSSPQASDDEIDHTTTDTDEVRNNTLYDNES